MASQNCPSELRVKIGSKMYLYYIHREVRETSGGYTTNSDKSGLIGGARISLATREPLHAGRSNVTFFNADHSGLTSTSIFFA